MDVEWSKENFPVTRNWAYLNNASYGACPKAVTEAVKDFMSSKQNYDSRLDTWYRRIGESKRLFARLIGARENEIAFVPNTTTGLNIVATMLRASRGSNVVVSDIEHPSNVLVWLRQRPSGLKTRVVGSHEGKVSPGQIEEASDENTLAIGVGQVGWWNGFRHDLRALSEIAHRHGGYLIVDGIQCVGAMGLDVGKDGIDFLSAGSYKWLLGPPGGGFLYIRGDLVEGLEPLFVGLASLKKNVISRNTFEKFDAYDIKYANQASRFEVGMNSEVSFAGAWAAMKLLLKIGINRIEDRISKLDDYLFEGLAESGLQLQTPEDRHQRFGIINFKARDNRKVEQELFKRKILVAARMGGIRVSPHFFNTEEEIDRLLCSAEELANLGCDRFHRVHL